MHAHDQCAISRRRFLALTGALGAAACLTTRPLLGRTRESARAAGIVDAIRQSAATGAMSSQPLRGGASAIVGSGGNVVALGGADGMLLVDAGIVGPRVAAEAAKLHDAPIRHVVNTHWHFDHTDANAYLRGRGATLVAHASVPAHMRRATRVADWEHTFPASPAAAIPTELVEGEHTLRRNDTTVHLVHLPGAHTDGDLAVHLREPDVLCAGDAWWNGIYPFIDYSTGGGIDGMIRATESLVARCGPRTLVVPGHGRVGGREDVRRSLDMLVAARERVARLKAQGRTEREVVAARPTAPFDERWAWEIITPALFARLLYQGV